MREPKHRAGRVEIADRHVLGLEVERARDRRPRFDQVVNDFVLPVDRDGLAAGQVSEINVMATPLKADVEPVMSEACASEPRPDTHRVEQIHRALLEYARPHAIDHVLAAAILDDDRIDAVEMQQVSKQQPCRTCTDDSDLRSHVRSDGATGRGCEGPVRGCEGPVRGCDGRVRVRWTEPSGPRPSHRTFAPRTSPPADTDTMAVTCDRGGLLAPDGRQCLRRLAILDPGSQLIAQPDTAQLVVERRCQCS